jgi:ubiquinone biosynthesis protein
MRRFRAYRVLRIALALARALPRYWLLLLREPLGLRPATQPAWDRAHERAAEQLRRLALALEGGLIKAAQIAGARADILPRAFIENLSQFHDAVPPRPFHTLAPTIEAALGASLEEVFAWVDPTPLGAASLAQVHRARLKGGEEVVIKVQYPEARRIFPLDLAMVRRVVALVQLMTKRLDLRTLADEVTRFIAMELDFRREASSTERLRELLADHPEVRVPRVYPHLTGDRVIVLEYLEGIQVTRAQELQRAGHKLSDVARRIGGLYGAMLFELGFFHGDPHPGNLLVLPDGRIGLLDYGLCKELPAGFARLLAQMMVSALIGDGEAALEAARALSFDVGELRPEQLRSLVLRIFGDADDDDLLAVLGGTRIRRIPDHFALVLRTMILLNGLSHRLAPGRRLVQSELIKHLAAGAATATSRPAARAAAS